MCTQKIYYKNLKEVKVNVLIYSDRNYCNCDQGCLFECMYLNRKYGKCNLICAALQFDENGKQWIKHPTCKELLGNSK